MVKRKSKKKSFGGDKIPLESAVDDDFADDAGGDGDGLTSLDQHEDQEERELLNEISRRGSGSGYRGKKKRPGQDGVVMDIDDADSSDDDDDAEAYEEETMEDDLTVGQWGRKKRYFYGGNPNDPHGKMASGGKEDEDDGLDMDEAELEALEGEKIQQQQLNAMDDEDFLGMFGASAKEMDQGGKKKSSGKKLDSQETIQLDLSKLSKKEKVRLFAQESPEFAGVLSDFDARLSEAKDKLGPIVQLIDAGTLPQGPEAKFIKTKYQILLSYCTNIACYVMFKAQRTSLKFHPITGRLVQYKQLLDQMDQADESGSLDQQIQLILDQLKSGKSVEALVGKAKKRAVAAERKEKAKSKKLRIVSELKAAGQAADVLGADRDDDDDDFLTLDERRAVEMYQATRKGKKDEEEDEEEEDEEEQKKTEEGEGEDDEEKRRSITYQIAKNKGLTPKRSKLQRNPRVKNRAKFEKAKVRRKGQVREVRKDREAKKYGGEMFGINARVKKGIKLQ